jgi:hypothetical protein
LSSSHEIDNPVLVPEENDPATLFSIVDVAFGSDLGPP